MKKCNTLTNHHGRTVYGDLETELQLLRVWKELQLLLVKFLMTQYFFIKRRKCNKVTAVIKISLSGGMALLDTISSPSLI